ncbi:uncharacterized protein METZ01_LOCUS27438 [marine metagenome]|uniref:Uncharacterized protein n=1 Tax=marine metagenome TaxID=408172 RepID=A0A381Q6W1_9ZZZZ
MVRHVWRTSNPRVIAQITIKSIGRTRKCVLSTIFRFPGDGASQTFNDRGDGPPE